ncbi:MAG: cytochrome c [Nitrospinae bacterium]|nr:cytochrome c [Nitrospinota bacterium]
MKETIEYGRPNHLMPAWGDKGKGLKDKDVDDLVAFLRSWQKAPSIHVDDNLQVWGNPVNGKDWFDAICAKCHGENGDGTDGAPVLNDPVFLKYASDDFIRQTVLRGRQGTVMRSFLAGKDDAVTELEPRQIDDIVSYIRSWDKSAKPRFTLDQMK